MAAEETRFGGGANMESLRFGDVQIEEARYGSEIVWLNNQGPEFIGVSSGAWTFTRDADNIVQQGQVFSAPAGTDQILRFTAQDMDMPADNVVRFELFWIDGSAAMPARASLGAQTITPGAITLTRTATIDFSNAVQFPRYQAIQDLVPRDEFILVATDNVGSTNELSFFVDEVSFLAPSIAVTSDSSSTLGTASFLSRATITQHPTAIAGGAIAEYSTDGGTTWIAGTTVTRSLSAPCGGSSSWTVMARSRAGTRIAGPVSGTGRITVSAPQITIGVPHTGCGTIPSFSVSQTCGGVVTAGRANLRARTTCPGGMFTQPGGASGTITLNGVTTNLTPSGSNGWADTFQADYDASGTITTTISCAAGACYNPVPTASCTSVLNSVTCTFPAAAAGYTYTSGVCTGTGLGSGDITASIITGPGSTTATCVPGVVGVRSVSAIPVGTIATQGTTTSRTGPTAGCAVSCV